MDCIAHGVTKSQTRLSFEVLNFLLGLRNQRLLKHDLEFLWQYSSLQKLLVFDFFLFSKVSRMVTTHSSLPGHSLILIISLS